MSIDKIAEAARDYASTVVRVAPARVTATDFMAGARWAMKQEPTDAEVEAAAEVWQAHSRLHHPIENLEPSCAECGYAFGWPGISESEEGRRYREHVAHAALTAAREAWDECSDTAGDYLAGGSVRAAQALADMNPYRYERSADD